MITTHVLDLAAGRPAAGIAVRLEREDGADWQFLSQAATDADGRVRDWPDAPELNPGVYRLTFVTSPYFVAAGRPTFYPEVSVVFEAEHPGERYHVPLLISPYGYSTYRGS